MLIGRPSGADVESPYLLSGIAECGECGGSLVAMTRSHGRQRMPFYGLRYHKRGVQYRPIGAGPLLARSLLIYGVGGVVAPFIGIKLIDLVLEAVGLV